MKFIYSNWKSIVLPGIVALVIGSLEQKGFYKGTTDGGMGQSRRTSLALPICDADVG